MMFRSISIIKRFHSLSTLYYKGEGCLIAAAGSLIGVGSDLAGSIR